MQVKVLGSGCANCHKLAARAADALTELHIDAPVESVTDIREIVASGIAGVPALLVDDRVVVAGRVPSVDELVALLSEV